MNIKWKKLNFYTKLIEKPGEDSQYALVEKQTNCIIKRGESEQEAIKNSIKELEKQGLKKTKIVIEDILRRCKNKETLLSKAIRDKFYLYFKTSIMLFIHPIIGTDVIMFDIIMFDKWLRTPEGVSTKDYIKEKFGLKASLFIERINKL